MAALLVFARLLAAGSALAVAVLIHVRVIGQVILLALLTTLLTLLFLARLLAALGSLAIAVEVLFVVIIWHGSSSSGSPDLKVRRLGNGRPRGMFR
ncbi:hypothetical protein ASD83_12455 [Devosia sp. Root685]|nr:hypothetical protein ASD83_12455 [Devosia sp. Root685]